jgi:hypothetical protein
MDMLVLAFAVPLVSITDLVAFTLIWTAAILVVLAKVARRTD